jgi:hypothetical protein
MFKRREKKCRDRIDFKEVDKPEHLYRTVGVRIESEQDNKLETTRLSIDRDELLML